jgi:hypothetical protein
VSIPLDSINFSNLPSWEEICKQYGNNPIIHGLNMCETYRTMVRNAGQPPKPTLAGLFNTGMNLLNGLFTKNFDNLLPKRKRNEKPYGVPYENHSLAWYCLQVTFRSYISIGPSRFFAQMVASNSSDLRSLSVDAKYV